jgi:hypothetical protein
MRISCVVICLGFIAGVHPAAAQTFDPNAGGRPHYDIQSENFDLWCQETERLPVERCNERRPEDVRTFEEHRAVVERFELQLLMDRERAAEAEKRVNRDYGAPWSIYDDRP